MVPVTVTPSFFHSLSRSFSPSPSRSLSSVHHSHSFCPLSATISLSRVFVMGVVTRKLSMLPDTRVCARARVDDNGTSHMWGGPVEREKGFFFRFADGHLLHHTLRRRRRLLLMDRTAVEESECDYGGGGGVVGGRAGRGIGGGPDRGITATTILGPRSRCINGTRATDSLLLHTKLHLLRRIRPVVSTSSVVLRPAKTDPGWVKRCLRYSFRGNVFPFPMRSSTTTYAHNWYGAATIPDATSPKISLKIIWPMKTCQCQRKERCIRFSNFNVRNIITRYECWNYL